MNRQRTFSFEREAVMERVHSLSEEQTEAIRAALSTLFEAALSVSEDSCDEHRED